MKESNISYIVYEIMCVCVYIHKFHIYYYCYNLCLNPSIMCLNFDSLLISLFHYIQIILQFTVYSDLNMYIFYMLENMLCMHLLKKIHMTFFILDIYYIYIHINILYIVHNMYIQHCISCNIINSSDIRISITKCTLAENFKCHYIGE